MSSWWSSLSEGQGSVVAASVTVVGAGLGVVLGWFLFRGKVMDLEGALDASKARLEDHERVVGEKLDVINDQIGALLDGLGDVRGGLSDIQAGTATPADTAPQANRRDALKQSRLTIRDKIETLASSHPDGRTRARYGRIPRWNYDRLLEALQGDDRLGAHAQQFYDANALWKRFQRGRAVPTQADVQHMRELCQVLAPNAAAEVAPEPA